MTPQDSTPSADQKPVSVGRFRKTPVVIDAEQITEERAWDYLLNNKPLPFGIGFSNAKYHQERKEITNFTAHIDTLEGRMTATIGDWIIRGVKGELYPCKPDIFEATYEPAI